MNTASLVMGILSILGMFFGFIPCLGAYNWINIPFAIIGLIVGILAYTKDDGEPKNNAIAGMVMCVVAMSFGLIRLILGGGVL